MAPSDRLVASAGSRLGSAVVSAVPLSGGHTPQLLYRLVLADGRRVVLKTAAASADAPGQMDWTSGRIDWATVLRGEIRAYRILPMLAPWQPEILADFEEAGWVALLMEDLSELDQAGVPIIAAFWCYPTSHSDWRLVIASPLVDTVGSLQAYDQIFSALDQLPEARISSMVIYAVGEDDPVVRYLRRTLPPGAARQNFNANVIIFDFGAYAPYLPEDESSLRVFVYRIVLQSDAEAHTKAQVRAPA